MNQHMHRNLFGTTWTPEMDDVLRRERAEGKSFSEAVEAVNKTFNISMTRNAAIGRASRLGMPGRKQPPPKPKAPKKPRIVVAKMYGAALQNHEAALAARQVEFAASVVEMPKDAGPNAVSFFDAKRCHCRWPYGDPRDLETFRFCGEPALDDRPYCAGHTSQAKGQNQ